jgi:hypothetical protein
MAESKGNTNIPDHPTNGDYSGSNPLSPCKRETKSGAGAKSARWVFKFSELYL